jgi:predicted transcriptional regulator
MPTQVVSIRVPDEWVSKLKDLADAEGCEITKVVKDAIASHLQVQNAEDVVSLQQRVRKLERQMKRLLTQ